MAHPLLLGLLGAFVLARLLIRRRWRHAHGGGCGRFRGGPIDLGAPDPREDRLGGRFGRRWARWQPQGDARAEVKAPPVDLGGALELNQRQRELFEEVVGKATARLGAAQLTEALAILGREPFDRAALEFLVDKGELADDLEQLHFSLTAEQRTKLRSVASA